MPSREEAHPAQEGRVTFKFEWAEREVTGSRPTILPAKRFISQQTTVTVAKDEALIATGLVGKLDRPGYSGARSFRGAEGGGTIWPEVALMNIKRLRSDRLANGGATNSYAVRRAGDFSATSKARSTNNRRVRNPERTDTGRSKRIEGRIQLARSGEPGHKGAELTQLWMQSQLNGVAGAIDHRGPIRFVNREAEDLLQRKEASLLGVFSADGMAIENRYARRLPGDLRRMDILHGGHWHPDGYRGQTLARALGRTSR